MAGTAELKNLRLFNRIQGPSLPPYHTLSVLKCVIRAANLIGFVCRFFFQKKSRTLIDRNRLFCKIYSLQFIKRLDELISFIQTPSKHNETTVNTKQNLPKPNQAILS